MTILRPTKVLENKTQLMEMAGLLLDLKESMLEKYPLNKEEDIQWALEQSVMRLSLRDGHEFG